jgi:hypothetical protein
MNKHLSKYYILILLAVMFAAPGIAAYLFYQNPAWLGSAKINKGTLLTHPILLSSPGDHSKWRIVFWNPGACEKVCTNQLDVLARVRLALGRKLYQVDQWLVVDEHSLPLTRSLSDILKAHDFKHTRLSVAQTKQLALLPANPRIFIANPDNYLILSYQAGVNPDDIYKDLKLLLNTTETKSG